MQLKILKIILKVSSQKQMTHRAVGQHKDLQVSVSWLRLSTVRLCWVMMFRECGVKASLLCFCTAPSQMYFSALNIVNTCCSFDLLMPCLFSYSAVVFKIVYCCLLSGIFPDVLKEAVVKAPLKESSPVKAVLSNFGPVLDWPFLQSSSVFDSYQSGFWCHLSTETSLSKLVQELVPGGFPVWFQNAAQHRISSS